nr:MMPL family transporter [Micromonospora sp. DSM 115978]
MAAGAAAGADVASYTAALSAVPGVARVDVQPGPTGGAAFWTVVPAVEPISADGERLVTDVRAVPAPFPTAVGGAAADHVDTNDVLSSRMPWAAGFIALVTFLALFAMFGSVVVPLLALAVNVLSLSATFGVLVWVFQDGNLSGLFGFT